LAESRREALSGAAPIAPEILELFYAAGVPVMEGYGTHELVTCTTSTVKVRHRRLTRHRSTVRGWRAADASLVSSRLRRARPPSSTG